MAIIGSPHSGTHAARGAGLRERGNRQSAPSSGSAGSSRPDERSAWSSGAELERRTIGHLRSRPISGRIAACLSRPPRARRRCVASAGKLVERRIDRQPEAAAVALVEVDLGPRVVVERALHAADVDQADGDARRNAERARHRDIERRVLVAVADLRAQHFARGRQADGRLLVEQRVDVARQPLGAGASARDAAHRRRRPRR